jgi:primosomal protein N' (replication factor Y)
VPGEVLVQTYAPFHPAVQSSRNADVDTFFDQEIEMRRELSYPPFTRLATVLFKGKDEQAVDACAKEAADRLKSQLSAEVKLTGPAPAPLAKAKGYHRAQFMLRSAAARDYVPALRGLLKSFKPPKGVTIAVNVDALSLM